MPERTKQPLIIAHRGASAVAPENTLAAFARALDDGADGIEFDVQLARDGVPVIIHDSDLRRTANRTGGVADIAAAELGSIDAGSWFNRKYPKLAQPAYEKECVPTLAQVFRLITSSARKDCLCYVELKIDKPGRRYATLAQAVADLIAEYSLHRRAIVVSFNLHALSHMKKVDPAIRTGALFEPRTKPLTALRKRAIVAGAIESGAEEILLHRLMARRRLVDLAAHKGLRPVVWTVDDARWIARAKDLGIHALITNDPAKLIRTSKR